MQLFAVELHGAILEACCAQLLSQSVEHDERIGILALVSTLRCSGSRLARAVDHAVLLEQFLHLLVGVAAVRLDDGVHDAVCLHVSLLVEVEDHGERQLLLVGAERADEVAETFWEHRYGAVDEVDARGTLHRLLVYHGAFGDVVRHIGDVHAHLPESVLQLSDGERVVEVLRILRVDGAGEHVAEVLALGIVRRCYLCRNLLGSLLHVLRILIRQAVLREDGVHLHVVVARLAEHVDNLADHVAVILVGPLHDAHYGVVAVLATL